MSCSKLKEQGGEGGGGGRSQTMGDYMQSWSGERGERGGNRDSSRGDRKEKEESWTGERRRGRVKREDARHEDNDRGSK